MIGIHIYDEIIWFDFPHTHENQDMLIRRLEREARQRHLNIRLKRMHQNFATMGRHMEEAAKRTRDSLAAFGRACSELNLGKDV